MSLHDALQDLEYPCDYPFKLICQPQAVDAVRAQMLASLRQADELKSVSQRASSSGKYIALTVTIVAPDAAQIEKVYADLAGVEGIVTSL